MPLAKLDCDTSKTCVSSRSAVSPGTRPACAAAATSTQPTAHSYSRTQAARCANETDLPAAVNAELQKALAQVPKGGPVVFWHTGGVLDAVAAAQEAAS